MSLAYQSVVTKLLYTEQKREYIEAYASIYVTMLVMLCYNVSYVTMLVMLQRYNAIPCNESM